jgi:hypothetical protein
MREKAKSREELVKLRSLSTWNLSSDFPSPLRERAG